MEDKLAKQRIVSLLMTLVNQPFKFTKRELANKFGVSPQTIKRDFDDLRTVRVEVVSNKKHFYGLQQDKVYDQLSELLHFTEKEQHFLRMAIEHFNRSGERDKTAKHVLKKLDSLYDFRKLGLDVLREPHLQKINLLEKAKNEGLQVCLKNYHSSNSNTVKDRLVEPLQVSAVDDMLYAFDVDNQTVRHFRLTRIGGIDELGTPATGKVQYSLQDTDPFYIVHQKQVKMRLEFGVAAYNELIARFPLTRRYIQPFPSGDRFELSCKVNANFYGVSNFILSCHNDKVIVHDPPELLELLQEKLKELQHFFAGYQ